MMEVQKAVAMRLPDGSHIKIEVYNSEPADGDNSNKSWMSLEISRIYPTGREELMCGLDYDEIYNGSKGLRTLVYNSIQADPIFIKEDQVE